MKFFTNFSRLSNHRQVAGGYAAIGGIFLIRSRLAWLSSQFFRKIRPERGRPRRHREFNRHASANPALAAARLVRDLDVGRTIVGSIEADGKLIVDSDAVLPGSITDKFLHFPWRI